QAAGRTRHRRARCLRARARRGGARGVQGRRRGRRGGAGRRPVPGRRPPGPAGCGEGMTARGHRAVEHTADVRVEAWGPTREDCLAEAVAGLVATFADTAGAAPMETITTRLDATADADLLAAVLDEVIYLLDAHSVVPCGAELTPGPTGVE